MDRKNPIRVVHRPIRNNPNKAIECVYVTILKNPFETYFCNVVELSGIYNAMVKLTWVRDIQIDN